MDAVEITSESCRRFEDFFMCGFWQLGHGPPTHHKDFAENLRLIYCPILILFGFEAMWPRPSSMCFTPRERCTLAASRTPFTVAWLPRLVWHGLIGALATKDLAGTQLSGSPHQWGWSSSSRFVKAWLFQQDRWLSQLLGQITLQSWAMSLVGSERMMIMNSGCLFLSKC